MFNNGALHAMPRRLVNMKWLETLYIDANAMLGNTPAHAEYFKDVPVCR